MLTVEGGDGGAGVSGLCGWRVKIVGGKDPVTRGGREYYNTFATIKIFATD